MPKLGSLDREVRSITAPKVCRVCNHTIRGTSAVAVHEFKERRKEPAGWEIIGWECLPGTDTCKSVAINCK